MEQAIVADEMARAGAPAPTNSLGVGIVGPTIVVHGSDAQKRRYLRPSSPTYDGSGGMGRQ